MKGSPYRKFSVSRSKRVVPGTGPEVLPSGDPGHLREGTPRPVSCLGSGGIQYLKGTWPEQIVDMSICCTEHDVSMCFNEHGGTLLMSWRLWPEPTDGVVDVLQ
ncbi:hypothetical protein F2Q69_00053009 [Brassica cretica]|uniref:Uncharacterized protein n=1 Tax=Brassica cretica TaxID=69181 RepID=A0A8S9NAQ8_BRACR|nr:hypothetical protein F2Q69_00053009 [Brassica cretica]